MVFFLSMFLRFGTPTWSYVGPLDSSKTPPRRLQDASQDEVRDIFRSSGDFCRFRVDFGSIFNRFWIDFGSIFDWFSIEFWLILDRFFRFLIHSPPRFLIDSNTQCSCFFIFCSSAVADTQLCCALDPPRQALCLRMAYGVLYPNLLPYHNSL